MQEQTDEKSQVSLVHELAAKRRACTYCPLKLFNYVPQESKPSSPSDPAVIDNLLMTMQRPLKSVDPCDYEYFLATFGDAIRIDAEPVSYTYLLEKLRVGRQGTDAMDCWIRALCQFGAYRRVRENNILQFTVMALVLRAIQCCDVRIPVELSIPHAIQVAPGLGEMTPAYQGQHVQNDIEGFILAAGLRTLQEQPF